MLHYESKFLLIKPMQKLRKTLPTVNHIKITKVTFVVCLGRHQQLLVVEVYMIHSKLPLAVLQY